MKKDTAAQQAQRIAALRDELICPALQDLISRYGRAMFLVDARPHPVERALPPGWADRSESLDEVRARFLEGAQDADALLFVATAFREVLAHLEGGQAYHPDLMPREPLPLLRFVLASIGTRPSKNA